MQAEEEIKRILLEERWATADSVEIVGKLEHKGCETMYWARVIFFEDYDINYIVVEYGDEYLDFFEFSFSKERVKG